MVAYPSALSYPRRFPERDLRCSLCQAGLRGHLTYQRACTKIRVRGCFLSDSTGGGLLPCRVWGSCEKSLGSFRSQRVFFLPFFFFLFFFLPSSSSSSSSLLPLPLLPLPLP